MTISAKPAQRQHRPWAIAMLLSVLLACLCNYHNNAGDIGGLQGHTDIGDGKTLINGAQILGKSIDGNTRDLVAISPQGDMDYDSKKFALSGRVLYGYGFSADLEGEKTRVTAREQTETFAKGPQTAYITPTSTTQTTSP